METEDSLFSGFDEIEWDQCPDDDEGPDDFGASDYDDEPDTDLTPEQLAEQQRAYQAKRFAPVPYKLKATKKIISVVDTETDPFSHGLIVKPFCLGFKTQDMYVDFWGDDCVDQFFEFLKEETENGNEYIIYAHNGGKFDFFFFLKFLDAGQTPLIMGGRLVKVFFQGQEFRDSFAILPQGLAGYQKDEIDYNNFTRDKREKFKGEILRYMHKDCQYTLELILGFHEMFGDKLTVASASLAMLNSFHGYEKFTSSTMDERFRAYYFGGRNQCFETGVLKPRPGKQFMMIDRNSMYPKEMADTLHPISKTFELQHSIDKDTDFACIEAINMGALPMRDEKGGLDFTCERGTFYATIHEINAGIDTGTLKILRVKHAWKFERKATFAEFVHTFYNLRLDAKAEGDLIRDILYKFNLNSPYGKFALNPRKFKQWTMTIGECPEPMATPDEPDGWTLHTQNGDIYIWSRPAPRKTGFINVATAASITGASRANLLRNLSLADRPLYCDTDSIICEGFNGQLDGKTLGGWKLEATADRVAIAGKKLYTLYNQSEMMQEKRAIKKASKGVRLEPHEIVSVCNGQEITYKNPVPTFNMDGSASFVRRRIRQTGKVKYG